MPKDVKDVSTTAWLIQQVSPPPNERWAIQYETAQGERVALNWTDSSAYDAWLRLLEPSRWSVASYNGLSSPQRLWSSLSTVPPISVCFRQE